MSDPSSRVSYQAYSGSMMQSPYISSAARSSAPVLSSSREGAAQYTAVSTSVYSPQAKAAAAANEQANKRRKAGNAVMTVIACLLLVAMGCILYFSGIFNQQDNGIYIPPSSGSSSQVIITNSDSDIPTASESDTPAVSDSDNADNSEGEDDDSSVNAVPGKLNRSQFADLNAFVSTFTEAGTTNIGGSVSSNELAGFAVASLAMNSSVYDYSSDGFSIGTVTYNYSLSETVVKQRISRYFGESVQIYPSAGDSGDNWMYYGGRYYFIEIPKSQGFAIVTDYSASGELVTVSFNVYESSGNDFDYYSMTAAEAEDAGCSLIGTGSATLGKTIYNGRETYLVSSIQAD